MKTLTISENEMLILETARTISPCTIEDIHERMSSGMNFLIVLRGVHALCKQGFLKQIRTNSQTIYQIKNNHTQIILRKLQLTK